MIIVEPDTPNPTPFWVPNRKKINETTFLVDFLRHIFFPLVPQAKLFLGKGTIGIFLEKNDRAISIVSKNQLEKWSPFLLPIGNAKRSRIWSIWPHYDQTIFYSPGHDLT